MLKADEFAVKMQATGVRLYVGSENSGARMLYEKMGYKAAGDAVFMVKG
jgi:predicted GNAT family acetyltransferase